MPVGVVFAVGLGVAVAADDVGFGVGFADFAVGEGIGVSVGTCIVVGLIKITLIALSSGTGETTFREEMMTPTTTTMRTTIPTMIVSAAMVRLLSSI